ncbi:DNA2-like helicase, partial [Cyphomyrmex costatus]
ISNNVDKSQTKISSFFTKIPNVIDDNKTSDKNSLFQATVEKKRKERDNAFEEEFHVSAKKKCHVKEEPLNKYCTIKTETFKSHDDSVLLSVLKDFKESHSNFNENEVTCKDAVLHEVKKRVDITVKSKQSVNILQNSVTIKNVNVLDVTDNNSHVLKEQDLNIVTLTSAVETMPEHRKTILHNLKKTESFEDFSVILNGDELDDFFDKEWHAQINFTTLERCKIINVKHESKVTVLTVQHLKSESIDTVACSGFWKDTEVKINDIVTIQATKGSQQWIVDNNNGFLITQPDLLISGTTIMGENICALSDVIKLLDDILRSKDTLDYLYASEMSLVDCRKRMMEYAPKIFNFIQHYIMGNKQHHISNQKDNFQGSINNIRDIEETVYIPQLGIKGRIDVTAEVTINSRRKIMPLELKTGRASYSLEHKGQVILYLMMMGFRDQDIDTGLLLYLKEAKGTCICNLKTVGKVIKQDDRYEHKLARVNIKEEIIENGILGSTFSENSYIIISTDARVNIAAGYIMHVSHDIVTVLLDKDITQLYANSTFHVDKYPSTGLSTFNYANVAGLLNNDEIYVKLRCIVIDRKPATFVEKLPRSVVSTSTRIISDLNENQQRAVLKAIAAQEYVLIKGMPGTGKTQTLVALIELLQELGSSVLITAHTHSAVDNILLKLLERNIDFLRLGSTKQIHPLLTCKSEEYAIASCDSPEELETLYNSKRIVGVTCYGAYHALLRRCSFDVCVVDESAQIMLPTVLRPLYSARKFILVGDPDQLPPIVKNKTAAKLGADESLFVRLDSDDNTVNLWKQYRMNGRIMRLANEATYRGKLVSGNKQVENATLTGTNMEQVLSSCERWVRSALSRNLDDSVVVLNTGSTYDLNAEFDNGNVMFDQTYSNIWEVAITSRLIQVLTEAGVCARNIGIIAPYNAHINLLKKIIDKEIEVNTVDQYQGRDKDVILYSCTKSVECDTKKEFEILNDQRRLTVAITRARHKLIIIADKVTLLRYVPFKNLFDVIEEKNVINLQDGEEDFSWKSLIRRIDNRDKEFKD